ncbi:hypothetical protein N9595_04055 [Bacteroidia bacterium]|nr:hypothetical protein [Bacteroidia bacterium]
MRSSKTVIVVLVLLASTVYITAKQHVIKPAVGDIAPEISM